MARIHLYASKGDNQNLENELKQVDINLPDKLGETALHLAALEGHIDTVKLLLEKGANIYLLSKSGNNALHYAVLGVLKAKDDTEKKGSYYQIFELLLLAEAKLRRQNSAQLPEKWLKDTVNDLKVTPVTRLQFDPEIQKALLNYIAKAEQSLIAIKEKDSTQQSQSELKQRRSIKPLDDSSKKFGQALRFSITSIFNAITNLPKKIDPQLYQQSEHLLSDDTEVKDEDTTDDVKGISFKLHNK